MNRIDLIHALANLDRHGVYVLLKRDIEKMFPDEGDKAMEKSLQRMVADGLLVRAAKGVYVNPAARSRNGWIVEEVAKALRPGKLCYVSLESMLSEFGAISQAPINRITVMTTGASGLACTPYGDIEFTHTKRQKANIVQRTNFVKGRPLRFATKQTAYRDLVRVGRNLNMVDQDELAEG